MLSILTLSNVVAIIILIIWEYKKARESELYIYIEWSTYPEIKSAQYIKHRANILLLLQYLKSQFRGFTLHSDHQTNNVCNSKPISCFKGLLSRLFPIKNIYMLWPGSFVI